MLGQRPLKSRSTVRQEGKRREPLIATRKGLQRYDRGIFLGRRSRYAEGATSCLLRVSAGTARRLHRARRSSDPTEHCLVSFLPVSNTNCLESPVPAEDILTKKGYIQGQIVSGCTGCDTPLRHQSIKHPFWQRAASRGYRHRLRGAWNEARLRTIRVLCSSRGHCSDGLCLPIHTEVTGVQRNVQYRSRRRSSLACASCWTPVPQATVVDCRLRWPHRCSSME